MPSQTLKEYIDTMHDCVKLYYPNIPDEIFNESIKYSIKKRYKSNRSSIDNNYTKEHIDKTILDICDYIADKQPIVTGYGVLFQRHGSIENPLKDIIEEFLNARSAHKNQMLSYPKGHEMYEYYNLLQSLTKMSRDHFRAIESEKLA